MFKCHKFSNREQINDLFYLEVMYPRCIRVVVYLLTMKHENNYLHFNEMLSGRVWFGLVWFGHPDAHFEFYSLKDGFKSILFFVSKF